ncbi:unnamed protein product [Calypogeia fissa]
MPSMALEGQLKPSRSEAGEILNEEERAMYSKQVEEFLKATTPVRPLKPSRSDLDEALMNGESAVPADACKAEMERFKQLEAFGELLKTEGGTVNDDSYVETPYYDDLNSVDKSLHHQTGTGFIATGQSELPFTVGEDAEKIFQTSTKTNPACNDWQPAPPKDVPTEAKVRRSESSDH